MIAMGHARADSHLLGFGLHCTYTRCFRYPFLWLGGLLYHYCVYRIDTIFFGHARNLCTTKHPH